MQNYDSVEARNPSLGGSQRPTKSDSQSEGTGIAQNNNTRSQNQYQNQNQNQHSNAATPAGINNGGSRPWWKKLIPRRDSEAASQTPNTASAQNHQHQRKLSNADSSHNEASTASGKRPRVDAEKHLKDTHLEDGDSTAKSPAPAPLAPARSAARGEGHEIIISSDANAETHWVQGQGGSRSDLSAEHGHSEQQSTATGSKGQDAAIPQALYSLLPSSRADNASVMTIASSSIGRRRSFDTNASMRVLVAESIRSDTQDSIDTQSLGSAIGH